MPTVANGIDLDWASARPAGRTGSSSSANRCWAVCYRPDRKGIIRILSYVNHAHMGLYRDANKGYLAGKDPTPEITETSRSTAR